jgi:hypothetical protein
MATVNELPRLENVPLLIWGIMANSKPITEMISGLQSHDRDDLRQDISLQYWRKALRLDCRGAKVSNLTKWLVKDISQWIGARSETAVGDPMTRQQIEDSLSDPLSLQRSVSEESRLQKLDAELAIVQAQFAADVAVVQRAKHPKTLCTVLW